MDGVGPLEDETIFSVSTMAEYLKTGTDSQRTVILFELQQLLDHCFEDTLTTLVPVLCEEVQGWTEELQISSAEALLDVVQQDVPRSVATQICRAAFCVVRNSNSEDIFESWGEILVVVLPNVKWDASDELSDIIATLDGFATAQDEVCRKLAARVLGSLSMCLTGAEVERHILSRALHLADDSDIEVRGMVAESLAFIGAVVDVQVTEQAVWPKILALLGDADARIHAATLRTVAHILESHREKHPDALLYRELLPPVFAKECAFSRKAATEDQRTVDDDTYLLLEIISEVFGQFVYSMYPSFTDDAGRKDAYKAFLAMATCNGPIVRRYCAFNIPGVAKSLANRFSLELSGIVEFLSRDPDSETRWNLAAGIHETTSILMTRSSVDNLFKAVVSLLQDENPLVRMNTLEHFFELLSSLTREFDNSSVRKLAPVFQNLTLLSEGNWRTQELLARQLEKATSLVPPDSLRANVLPLLYQMAEESTYLVRKAAMPAIARGLWCIPLPADRQDAMRTFIFEWGDGGVFWMRIAFIECAQAALNCFSGPLFKYLFAPTLYKLAEDHVPNVRLKLATMIHEMAPSCMGTNEFRMAIEKLQSDSDVDVLAAIKSVDQRILDLTNDMRAYRIEDEKREIGQAELEDRAERSKIDHRRRKQKIRASTLIPKMMAPLGKGQGSEPSSPVTVVEIQNVTAEPPLSPKGRKSLVTLAASMSKTPNNVKQNDDGAQPASLSSKNRKNLLILTPSGHEDEDDAPRSFGKKLRHQLGKRIGK